MANSKYEYVKLFEDDDEVMLPNLIVVRVVALDFRRFSYLVIQNLHYFQNIVIVIVSSIALKFCAFSNFLLTIVDALSLGIYQYLQSLLLACA